MALLTLLCPGGRHVPPLLHVLNVHVGPVLPLVCSSGNRHNQLLIERQYYRILVLLSQIAHRLISYLTTTSHVRDNITSNCKYCKYDWLRILSSWFCFWQDSMQNNPTSFFSKYQFCQCFCFWLWWSPAAGSQQNVLQLAVLPPVRAGGRGGHDGRGSEPPRHRDQRAAQHEHALHGLHPAPGTLHLRWVQLF